LKGPCRLSKPGATGAARGFARLARARSIGRSSVDRMIDPKRELTPSLPDLIVCGMRVLALLLAVALVIPSCAVEERTTTQAILPEDRTPDAGVEVCDADGDGFDSVWCGGCDLDDRNAETSGPSCGVGCSSNVCTDPKDPHHPQ
jgi:hypothetical protein